MCAARYWLGTCFDWEPPLELPERCCWLRGQQETCPTTGRLHHQIYAAFTSPVRRPHVIRVVGAGHWEASRSDAAEKYVWKEATRVADTQFELGGRPLKRNSAVDWESVRAAAVSGDLSLVPADIFVRYFIFNLGIILPYKESLPTIHRRLLSCVPAQYFGDQLGLVNLAEHGKKPERLLILRIQEPSGGVDIEVRQTLLLMNFVVLYFNYRNNRH